MPKPDGTPTKAELDAKKKRSEAARMGHNVRKRQEWEQSPEGQKRLSTASDLLGTKAPVGLIYQTRGWSTNPDPVNNPAEATRPRHYDRQIPGLEDPDAVAENPRWEDMDDRTRSKAERALKVEHGIDMDYLQRAMGAQIDQAYFRAESHLPKGQPTSAAVPYSRDFYDEKVDPQGKPTPRGVMEAGAEATGLRLGQYAALSSITSPNAKFQQGDRFPNDETAQAAAFQALSQDPLTAEMPRRRDDPSKQMEGRPANARKAIDAAQQFQNGVPVSAAVRHVSEYQGERKWTPTEEAPPLFDSSKSPKTGPYLNSWLKSTNASVVGDVHTAGGGALPHLSSDKPVIMNPDGTQKTTKDGALVRDKSAREKVIERRGLRVHEAVDYATRMAMAERGLGSTRRTQAAQWGEERLQRKEARPAFDAPTPAQAYKHMDQPAKQEMPGQGSLDFSAQQPVSGREPIPAKKPGPPLLSQKQLEKNHLEEF